MDKLKLDGRVAVVTGGAQGIGFACAQALAEAGARVTIADVSPQAIRSGLEGLRALGLTVEGEVLDVTRSEDVERVADRVVAGHGKVDILVANAGIARSGTAAEHLSDEHWLNVLDVNCNGVFWCDRAFGRRMLERGTGSIVNMGSMAGLVAVRPQKQAYYNASKGAVHQLTKSLAAEWADRGVRVNAVAPTYIETPLNEFAGEALASIKAAWMRDTPMGRMGRADEVASAVHFLASDAASLVTGSILLVDAGFTCW